MKLFVIDLAHEDLLSPKSLAPNIEDCAPGESCIAVDGSRRYISASVVERTSGGCVLYRLLPRSPHDEGTLSKKDARRSFYGPEPIRAVKESRLFPKLLVLPERSEAVTSFVDHAPPPSGFGLRYAWEKLWVASDVLIGGEGPVQKRLFSAVLSALTRLRPEHLPPDLWRELESIQSALETVGPVAGMGGFEASSLILSDERAEELMTRTISVYTEVKKRYDLEGPLGGRPHWLSR